jgi:hypothetical protein
MKGKTRVDEIKQTQVRKNKTFKEWDRKGHFSAIVWTTGLRRWK